MVVIMPEIGMRAGGAFDPETIDLMRRTLEQCWDEVPLDRRALVSKTALAQRILGAAAEGERDPARLRAAAFIAMPVVSRSDQ
jgi:hypothetical protein